MPRRAAQRQALYRQQSVPAPVGGWNTRDAKDAMRATDAVEMVNWIPDIGDVRTRDGITAHATGVGSGAVEAIMPYEGASGTKLLAASATNVYDATSSGAASSLASGFSNGNWDWANFEDEMGIVNGANLPRVYDGTTLSIMTISGTGLTVNDLVGITVFKSFSFFWENDSQDFWYSNINVLGGVLTKFPLSRVAKLGGKLFAIETLSMPGGGGGEKLDDMCVFIMTTGEVLIYAGTDPGSTSTWALIGQYRIGKPIGDQKSIIRVDGDIYVVTDRDYVSITQAIQRSGRIQPSKLTGAARDAVSAHKANSGWQMVYYPAGSLLFVNVPVTSTVSEQHVLNLESGGACKFTGMNARSWGVLDGELYIGSTSDGTVKKALQGDDDDGTNIVATAQHAWTNLGAIGDKQITATRNLVSAFGSVDIGIGFAMDYATPEVATVTSTGSGGTAWGSPWGSPWSPLTKVREVWSTGGVYGEKVSCRMSVNTNQVYRWLRTDYEFESIY